MFSFVFYSLICAKNEVFPSHVLLLSILAAADVYRGQWLSIGSLEVRSKLYRGQGQGHKKKSEAKDSPSEDRPFRGQGQECSMPRPRTNNTSVSVLRKGLQKFFSGDLKKKKKREGLHKNFSGAPQNFNNKKNSAVLGPRTGQFSRT